MSRLTHDKIGQIQQRLTDEGNIPTDELVFERMTLHSDNPLYWMQKAKDYRDTMLQYESDMRQFQETINVLYVMLAIAVFFGCTGFGYFLYQLWH